MTAIKILVAEDNKLHAAKIKMLLDKMAYDLVGVYPTVGEVLRQFKATQPDLVILDIELEEGGDGVDLARQLNEIRPVPIIFATSFEDTTTIDRALRSDPYAYLIKPVEQGALQAAIELAMFRFNKSTSSGEEQVAEYKGWSEDLLIHDSFFVKSGDRLIKLPAKDILWIELAENRYCDIVTAERKFHLRTSLNKMEQKLDPSLFVRTHRSTIVNVTKISSIQEADLMVSIGDHDLPMGRVFKDALLKRLKTI